MKKYIIKTSALGHEGQVDEVETNLPLEKFKEIDLKYGMKYRHQFTTIQDLKNGSEKEGYIFNITTLHKMDNDWEKIHTYKHDYFANYGNY